MCSIVTCVGITSSWLFYQNMVMFVSNFKVKLYQIVALFVFRVYCSYFMRQIICCGSLKSKAVIRMVTVWKKKEVN